jgi:GAF domain-containing protein
MARPSRTGGKKSGAKARNASAAKGRKTTKTKRRIAPAATRVKRRSISDPSRDLKEAREQQAATADILKVIASSPSDVQPVFEAIVASANRLIGGYATAVFRFIDGYSHLAAFTPINPDADEKLKALFPQRITDVPMLRPAQAGEVLQIDDTEKSNERLRDIARARGFRSVLYVPLKSKETSIGVIATNRRTPGPFSAHDVQLLQTFASQAVIAIENTRLFNETQEALERQTATADILKVIASSPSDVQPVFDAIAASANRLIGGFSTGVYRFVGDMVHIAAFTPTTPEADAALQAMFPMPRSEIPAVALVENGEPAQISDSETADSQTIRISRVRGWRSVLFTPLMNKDVSIGFISVNRRETGGFADHHVQLLRTFADQAVIAIENTRLFNETKEALEQQTATAEVLGVISSSTGDLAPVFDAMLSKAMELCGASFGVLSTFDGSRVHTAATYGLPPAYEEYRRTQHSLEYGPGTGLYRLLQGESFAEIEDLVGSEPYVRGDPNRRALVDLGGARCLLTVPLLKESNIVGFVMIFRQERKRFSEKQITLLKQFAAQAVIAIENARLLNELRHRTSDLSESLQQQTATADVLKVISRAAFDLDSVMNALTQSASELCKADISALYLREGNALVARGVAHLDAAQADFIWRTPLPIDDSTYIGRTFQTGAVRNIADLGNLTEVGQLKRFGEVLGFNSILFVPLMREARSVGIFALARARTGQFSPREVELVQTFADQAVIAVENVRLFDEVQARTRELSEALTYQTGSANILKVIASSPTNVEPVLKTIVENACEVCEAYDAIVVLRDGDDLRPSAHHGPIPLGRDRWSYDRTSISGRAIADRVTVHLRDVFSDEGADFPLAQEMCRRDGVGTQLAVPMLREGEAIGTIILRRTEVNPFTDKQIALLQTFADQAVIAIGNVRLFEEVQAKTRDLEESLQQQTATADVLKVISASPGELTPVFQTLLENAVRLCEAKFAVLFLFEDDHYRAVEGWNLPPGYSDFLANNLIYATPTVPLGRVLETRQPVHVPDLHEDGSYVERHPGIVAITELGGARTLLQVPMLKDDHLVGSIGIYRQQVWPFEDKQIALVQNFAAQAVIAIENARLLNELRQRTADLAESLQQQTATADVLQVVSASPGDLAPVFEKMLENAVRVCGAEFGSMNLLEGGSTRQAALYNVPAEFAAVRVDRVFDPHPKSALAMALGTRQVVHVADLRTTAAYLERAPATVELVELGGARTVVTVPMLREDEVIGAMTIFRNEIRPFTDKQIELLSNFAKQAVIAIENARLLKELRQRTDDLSKSLDNLRAAQDRLIQTEKLASLGQLTAGIAHEIKNPLNFVNNFAALSAELTCELNDLLKDAALTDKMREEVTELTRLLHDNLEKVVQHGKRADSIVKNMLLHSREGSGEQRAADINALVDESLNLAYHGARAEKSGFNITLQRDFDASAGSAELFPQEITRALLNLISNGFYAATKRSNDGAAGFEPTLLAATKSLGNSVEIRIRDNGAGIPNEIKEKIFNPFFTTKPAGEGTGLGLSMSHDIIVKQHGGTIRVHTELGAFTEFIVTLPRAISAQSPQRSTN